MGHLDLEKCKKYKKKENIKENNKNFQCGQKKKRKMKKNEHLQF